MFGKLPEFAVYQLRSFHRNAEFEREAVYFMVTNCSPE